MHLRRILLLVCLVAAAAAEEEEATQIVQGVTLEDDAVVQGVLEEDEATRHDPVARVDLEAEHDQIALESKLNERDSAGHAVHVPAPSQQYGAPSGGYNAPPSGDYGPPHPPKGGPRVPGPIPVPYAVPVRPGTVVLPQAPKGSGGYVGGQVSGHKGQSGGHGGAHVGGHGGGHASGHGGHGRPRPVYKPRPSHGGQRPRPRPYKPRPAYGPPPKHYGPPPKPKGHYGTPSGGHSSGGHSAGHSSGVHISGGHSSGGHSGGGHVSGGHSSGGYISGGHSSGGHSSGGHGSGGHSSGGHGSGGHVSGGHGSGGHNSGGHGSGGHSSGGHGSGGHSSGGHGSSGHIPGGHSSGGHVDSHASAAQHSGAYVAAPPVKDQSYSASHHEVSLQGGEVHSISSSQTYEAPSHPQQSHAKPQAQALQSYDAPTQPEETYSAPAQQEHEAPAQLEQTYEPAPAHQVSGEYGAPEAQAQVSYESPSSPAESHGVAQDSVASAAQASAQYQEPATQEYGAPEASSQEYGAPAAGGQEYGAPVAKAEAWPAPAADMPRIVSLDVQCDKSLMRVSVKFDRPFSGIIFSKGHYSNYNCIHLQPGSNSAESRFDISINSCGTTGNTENGNYGYGSNDAAGSFFENTIIIQYDPQVQEVWDQARKLRCTWHNQYEKAVTFRPFPVDMLDVVRADFAGDNVGCWMQIQVGKGPWAAEVSGLVKIGQTMTMVLAIKDDDNKFDMLVRNCMAHDGKRAPIQLVDQAGCITRPKLMSKFTKIKNFGASASVLSYAHFQAFKFPDSMEVHFQCTIQICRYQCSEQCGPAIEPRVPSSGGGYDAPSSKDFTHRVRRSVENQDVGIDRVIQVVSTRDLAFTLESPAPSNDTETVVFPINEDPHRICMSTPGFAATLIVLLAILVISSLLSAFLCLRYRGFGSGDRSVLSAFENPIFLHKKTSHF